MGETIRTAFSPDSRVGRLWDDMRRYYLEKEGKTEQELFREANIGYVSDPLGLRQFKNLTDTLEGPEALELCYARESCHPLLRKHQYPVYATLDNYDSENWVDDQIRFEMDAELKDISGKTPEEKAAKIFAWSLDNMQFHTDCPVEAAGWEALWNNCGACSESSSALYTPLLRAGLKPEFYFETEWSPSMRWLDRYHSAQNNPRRLTEDHVLLGIPDSRGGVLYLDRINEQINGPHPFALPLSPAAYNGALMHNTLMEMIDLGEPKSVLEWMETQEDLMPGDIFLYFRRVGYLKQLDPRAAEAAVLSALEVFPDHPAAPALRRLGMIPIGDVITELLDPNSTLNSHLNPVEQTSPHLASKIHFLLATSIDSGLQSHFQKVIRASRLGAEGKKVAQFFIQLYRFTAGLYAKTLLLNPNEVKAYLGLMRLLDQYKDFSAEMPKAVLAKARTLVEKFPDHTPFLYLQGYAAGVASNFARDKVALLGLAIESMEKVIAREPGHPRAYIKLAPAQMLLGQWGKAARALEDFRIRHPQPYPDDYHEFHIAMTYQNGTLAELKEAFEALVEDRPEDGVDLAVKTLREKLSLVMQGQVPNLESLRRAASEQQYYEKIAVIRGVLEKYPQAQPALEALRAQSAIYLGITQGAAMWRDMFGRIAQPRRPEVVASFLKGLEAVDGWLTRDHQAEEIVDAVLPVLRAMRDDLGKPFEPRILSIMVELVNNYIALGRGEKAERLFDEMLAMDSTRGTSLFAKRVMELRYPDPTNNLLALRIVLKRRDKFAPLVVQRLREAYERIPGHKPITVDFKAALPPLNVPLEGAFFQNVPEKSEEEARIKYDSGQCRELTCVMSW